MSTFHSLKIRDIQPTGSEAVCVTFDLPVESKTAFSFLPGQYVTIRTSLNGQEVRRAYSICSSPGSGNLSVGIKRVKDGHFSRYANEKLRPGEVLEVMPPEGRFTVQINSSVSRHYLAFAAGSGITPILSILTAVLEEEPQSTFSLIYGNRTPEESMFTAELQALEDGYPDRLFVERIYSKSREDGALFGRIERSTVNYLLKNKFARDDFDRYLICGPEGMIDNVRSLLLEKGVDEQDVSFELFSTEAGEAPGQETAEGKVKVTITLDDETETFLMSPDNSILQAALDHGIEAPYSCQGGICSTCIAHLKEGTAKMRKNQILTDGELEEGFILTCQAHPTSNSVTVDYDDI